MSDLRLDHDGVMTTVYPTELRKSVDDAATAWREFCSLPDAIKDEFVTSDDQAGTGYERKTGIGVAADTKENFDFSMRGNGYLARIDMRLKNPIVTKFIHSVIALASRNTEYLAQLGGNIEADYPIDGLADTIKRSAPFSFYRFLRYPPRPVSETIAEPHCDHSGLTMHLYESTDGCEFLSQTDGTWQPLPVKEGEAVVFGGMQAQLISRVTIDALSHRVVANNQTATAGRFAIVCFTLLHGVRMYDKKRFGRLQEKPADFNYDMHPDEFDELFV